MSYLINGDQLKPGDVIVYFCDGDYMDFLESEYTERFYCHSGICIGNNMVAHVHVSGLKVEPVNDSLCGYDYAAVLRQDFMWRNPEICKLKSFVENAKAEVIFDTEGVTVVDDLSSRNASKMQDILTRHFKVKDDGGVFEVQHHSNPKFFCSDFVVCAFFESGLITQDTLATIYNPKAMNTDSLRLDQGTFGEFSGYLAPSISVVHPDDPFCNHSR